MANLYYTCLLLNSNINSKNKDKINDTINKYYGQDWLTYINPMKTIGKHIYNYKSDDFELSIYTINNKTVNIVNSKNIVIFLLYGEIVLKIGDKEVKMTKLNTLINSKDITSISSENLSFFKLYKFNHV